MNETTKLLENRIRTLESGIAEKDKEIERLKFKINGKAKLTVREVSIEYDLCEDWVRKKAQRGDFPFAAKVGRKWLFDRGHMDMWFSSKNKKKVGT